jgi:hypothetical protein
VRGRGGEVTKSYKIIIPPLSGEQEDRGTEIEGEEEK